MGEFEQVLYKDFPSCLGHTQARNVIDTSALAGCYSVLKEISKIIKENKVDEYECIATHALRSAINQSEVLSFIKANTKFEIRVISGEEEARLTLLAVMMDMNCEESFLCINGGGGSTELGFHLPDGDRFVLLDVGAVNLYTDYMKGKKDIDSAIEKIRKLVTREFNKKVNFPVTGIEKVISMGGSIFTAGYIYRKDKGRKFEKLKGLEIPVDGLASIIEEVKPVEESKRKEIPGIDKGRLDSVLPGILIHYFLLRLLDKDRLIISTRTISDGLIYRMAKGKVFP
jgi:exopolyphosphatase/guanosine-5'-triphosphate,3'-diphosphate pyrophosphatase